MLTGINPVLDPLTLTPLRNAVVHSAWGRGKIDLPPGIAKKLQDTTVITSSTPVAPPYRKDIARGMRVETLNNRGNGRFKVKDERQASPQTPDQIRVDRSRSDESPRANDAERQSRIEKAMRPAQAQSAPRAIEQQPRAERTAQPARDVVRKENGRPQQAPAARNDRGNIREARPPMPIHQRQAEPRPQPQPPRATERPGRPANVERGRPTNPGRPAEVKQPAPQAQPQPARGGGHGQGQGQAQREQKVERKPGPPAAPGGGGGKGKGKKP